MISFTTRILSKPEMQGKVMEKNGEKKNQK